jgi:hypothetical protein
LHVALDEGRLQSRAAAQGVVPVPVTVDSLRVDRHADEYVMFLHSSSARAGEGPWQVRCPASIPRVRAKTRVDFPGGRKGGNEIGDDMDRRLMTLLWLALRDAPPDDPDIRVDAAAIAPADRAGLLAILDLRRKLILEDDVWR